MSEGKPPSGGRPPAKADWAIIERKYRTSLLSIEEIAKQHGLARQTVVYYAKKFGWQRDLSQEVRKATRTMMIENMAVAPREGESVADVVAGMSDNQIIEEAARTQVEVIRQHQKTLARGHKLTMDYLRDLETLDEGKYSLSGRVTILKDLAQCARVWIHEERRAFNIPDEQSQISSEDGNKTVSELRAEIVEDAKKLGLELTELSLGFEKVH